MRELARRLYDPIYRRLVPRRVGGPREDPDRRRRAARRQPRRRDPVRRAGDHARHRDRARPARSTAWPTTSSRTLPVVGTLWSRSRRRRRPPRQRVPAAARAAAARARVPRGHARAPGKPYSERYQLRRFGRGGFVEIAMRAGVPIVPDRRGRRRGVDADRVQDARAGQGARPPVLPGHRQHARCSGRSARVALLPGQVQAPGARPGALRRRRPTRSATRAAGSWTSPRRIREQIQEALYDMLRTRRSRSGSAERMGRRVLVTGLGTFWGGRVAQALESATRRRGRSSASTREEPHGRARAHRVRAQRLELLDPRPHRAGHPGRHDRAHVPRRRLDRRCGRARCTRSTSSAR